MPNWKRARQVYDVIAHAEGMLGLPSAVATLTNAAAYGIALLAAVVGDLPFALRVLLFLCVTVLLLAGFNLFLWPFFFEHYRRVSQARALLSEAAAQARAEPQRLRDVDELANGMARHDAYGRLIRDMLSYTFIVDYRNYLSITRERVERANVTEHIAPYLERLSNSVGYRDIEPEFFFPRRFKDFIDS